MAVIADASVFNYTKTCLVANNNDDTKSFDRTKQAMSDIYLSKILLADVALCRLCTLLGLMPRVN